MCQPCFRTISRMLKNDEDNKRLRMTFNASCQKVVVRHLAKRMPRTPLSSVQKFVVHETGLGSVERSSSVSFEDTSQNMFSCVDNTEFASLDSAASSSHPDARNRLNFSDITHESPSTPVRKLCSKDRKKFRKGCHVRLTFRSRSFAIRYSPICRMLQNGSIRKATKSLIRLSLKEKNQSAVVGIGDLVKNEINLVQKNCGDDFRGNQIQDFRKVEIQHMVDRVKETAPLLWNILTATIGKKANSQKKQNHLFAAFSILLHGRSQQINTFQYLISFSLYENNLEKEGYDALNLLGMSVWYLSLQNKLASIREHGQSTVKYWKKLIESQEGQTRSDDHTYCQTNDVRQNTKIPLFHDYTTQQPVTETEQVLEPGYRLNLDNLDYYVRVRNVTEDHQNQLHHYIQMTAVRDRVNCEHLPNDKPVGNLLMLENTAFLPSHADLLTLRRDFIQVMSQVACKHLPQLAGFQDCVSDTFTHQYSTEMGKPSVVIPLGIMDKSEQSTSELIEVLQHLHQFVPGARSQEECQQTYEREESSQLMRSVLLGGDQLTVKLIRSAHAALADGDSAEERLEGLLGMVEDFHEKISFLQVIVNKFYTDKSATDSGTLSNLRYLVNRKNVTSEAVKAVKKDYHAMADFIDTATDSHIISLMMHELEIEKIEENSKLIPNEAEFETIDDKKQWIENFVGNIVDNHIMNSMYKLVEEITNPEENNMEENCEDGIYAYATDFLKFGLLRRVNCVATRAGDGTRLLRHWKFGLVIYAGHHHTNYQLEAFLMLASVQALLTHRLSHQLIWNRFVNLSGEKNKNLEGDYVMELLVRSAKIRIKRLGPNHSASTVNMIGQVASYCHEVTRQFQNKIGVAPASRKHTVTDNSQDLHKMIHRLNECNIFERVPKRNHVSYSSKSTQLFGTCDAKKIHKFLMDKKTLYSKGKFGF